jgi:hypothetical protein
MSSCIKSVPVIVHCPVLAMPPSKLQPAVVSDALQKEIEALVPLLKSISNKMLTGKTGLPSLVKTVFEQIESIGTENDQFGRSYAKTLVMKQCLKTMTVTTEEPLKSVLCTLIDNGLPILTQAFHEAYDKGRESAFKEH